MKITTAFKSVSIVVACSLLLSVGYTASWQTVFDQTVAKNHTAETPWTGSAFFNRKSAEEVSGLSLFAEYVSAEIAVSMNSGASFPEWNIHEFLLRNLVMKSNNYLYNCAGSEIKRCEKKLTFEATLLKKACQYIELELYKL